MQVFRHVPRGGVFHPAPVVALGNFDGVHLGHQRVLQRALELARGCHSRPVAITFYRCKPVTAEARRSALLLESLRQRLSRIAALGFDTIIVQRLSPRWSTSAAESALRELLIPDLGVTTVVCARGIGFGGDGEGGSARLVAAGRSCGFDVDVADPVFVNGAEVHSAAVRRAILAGDLVTARAMLGRQPEVSGRVRHGFHRGRTIGFPTANVRVCGIVLPPNGVYAVRVRAGEWLYGGVANIGVNTTLGGAHRALEPHIFDFDGDLYGQRLDVQFVEALRAERKFPSVDELARQIRRDVEAARAILERA